MTDKYEDALKAMPHIRDHSDIVEWYYDYFYEIEEALKLASVAKIALESIANNTCCDKCNEASKVAREAITKFKEIKDE